MKLALTPIADQLKTHGMRQVEGLLELPGQVEQPRQLPAFFVVPTGDNPRPNANDQARDQAVDVSFSVFVVIDTARRNQAGISEELKVQTDKVRGALIGWTHPDASRACDYAGGRLASATGPSITWEVRFRTRYHERRQS